MTAAPLLRNAMRPLPGVLAALLALALLPSASAHGPPDPLDFETALLVDHNDDCGEDGASCRGTHDLIAVYVREKVDAQHGDVVVFRFFANAGSFPVKDVFTFKAGTASKTLELTTSDNRAFTMGGNLPVARVGTGASLNDPGAPGRFSVEITVKASELGPVGTALTSFKVEAFKGSTKGDYMPGGFVDALGIDHANPDQGSQPTNRAAAEYKLRGPTYYLTLTPPVTQEVAAGSETLAQVNVKNELRKTAQSITFTVTAGPGVTARFHDTASGEGEGYADTLRLDLAKAGSSSIHLALEGLEAGASGTLTITATTDQGGRSTVAVPYTVTEGQAGPTTDAETPQPEDKDAPGPAPLLLFGALALALALAIRRRS